MCFGNGVKLTSLVVALCMVEGGEGSGEGQKRLRVVSFGGGRKRISWWLSACVCACEGWEDWGRL